MTTCSQGAFLMTIKPRTTTIEDLTTAEFVGLIKNIPHNEDGYAFMHEIVEAIKENAPEIYVRYFKSQLN